MYCVKKKKKDLIEFKRFEISFTFPSMIFTPDLARFVSLRVENTRHARGSAQSGSSRRSNLDLSNITHITRAHIDSRVQGGKRPGANPDEPRTNGATNQWCDGSSLLSLTQRVYHTENRRTNISSLGTTEGKDTTDPPLIPHARLLVLYRVQNDSAVPVCCTVLIERDER